MRSKYDKSLNGVGLSLFKFCGFDVSSGNLRNVDRVIREEEYDNIIVLMYSGLNINLLDIYADECEYLRSHLLMELTSVWPATSVCALTSLVSGKVPLEHKVFGNCSEDFDKNIDYSDIINGEFINKINANSHIKAYGVLPFGIGTYSSVDDAFDRILSISKNNGRKIIFGYFNDLAQTLSKNGVHSNLVNEKLNDLTSRLENLLDKLENSLVLVLSDCGYSDCSDIMLQEYPKILELIDKVAVNDNRFCALKLKSSYEEFRDKFIGEFKNDFVIYSKDEVIDKCLFGEADNNSVNLDFDCVTIGRKDKRLNFGVKRSLDKASNAGMTNKELLVPVIALKKKISREFVRQAVSDDFSVIRNMCVEIQAKKVAIRQDVFFKHFSLTTYEFSQLCSRGSGDICFVYERDEKIIGFITLKHVVNLNGQFDNQYNYLSIERLYVLEEYRRQGVATKLYEEAVKFARKRHIKKIEVEIWNFDKDLDLFFQSLSNSELYKVLELDV